jgi:hypothetical protein
VELWTDDGETSTTNLEERFGQISAESLSHRTIPPPRLPLSCFEDDDDDDNWWGDVKLMLAVHRDARLEIVSGLPALAPPFSTVLGDTNESLSSSVRFNE